MGPAVLKKRMADVVMLRLVVGSDVSAVELRRPPGPAAPAPIQVWMRELVSVASQKAVAARIPAGRTTPRRAASEQVRRPHLRLAPPANLDIAQPRVRYCRFQIGPCNAFRRLTPDHNAISVLDVCV